MREPGEYEHCTAPVTMTGSAVMDVAGTSRAVSKTMSTCLELSDRGFRGQLQGVSSV